MESLIKYFGRGFVTTVNGIWLEACSDRKNEKSLIIKCKVTDENLKKLMDLNNSIVEVKIRNMKKRVDEGEEEFKLNKKLVIKKILRGFNEKSNENNIEVYFDEILGQ